MRRSHRLLAVLAIASAVGVGASPADAANDPGAVTLDCRVHMEGAWPTDEVFNAEVRPVEPLRLRTARGPVILTAPDGTVLKWKANFLRCRRDGGLVPEAGGANIADFTGMGTIQSPGGATINVNFQAHVEDRGEAPERRVLDFFALRAVDALGNEVYFNANSLARGTVKLIPVDQPD